MGPRRTNKPSGGTKRAPLHLVGAFRHTLDDKRRVALPRSYREALSGLGSDTYVLCRQLGGDACLALYAPGVFEDVLEQLEALRREGLGVGSKAIRAYLRGVRRSTAFIAPDGQGRIPLTEEQCKFAGVAREVVFVGSGDHVELWAPERLESDDGEEGFQQLAHQLFG